MGTDAGSEVHRGEAYLGELTGVRSGKRSFYSAYLRSAERLEHAIRALDRISHALVRTAEGPRALVDAVVRAAAEHLQAEWLLLAMADGVLPVARPRYVLLSGSRLLEDEHEFPRQAREHLRTLRTHPWEIGETGPDSRVVRVPMTLDGEPVGGIAGLPEADVDIADTDLAILRVLANQAAVALHNSFLLHATTQLRGRTEQLSEAAERQARDLAARNAELQETQRRLIEAMQRQTLDDERHRIARELHDSVTQDVLSAGMTIEVCRAELADTGADREAVASKLGDAKGLTQHAVERLRAAIYALHNSTEEPPGSLPALLERLSTVHLPSDLTVSVSVRGEPVSLPAEAENSLLRITGEALFNVVTHTDAGRAIVRLRYLRDRLTLSVSDDGNGDPAQLRRMLKVAQAADLGGAHRGLVNMRERTEELGGTLSFRRSTIGGIMLLLRIPLPLPASVVRRQG